MYAFTITLFSPLWYICLISSLVGIVSVVYLVSILSEPVRNKFLDVVAFMLLFDLVFCIFYFSSLGVPLVSCALPLQFCSLVELCCAIAILTRSQIIFETCLLVGMIGALQALLFPGFSVETTLYFFEYFIFHSAYLAIPLILVFGCGMRPRKGAGWRVPLLNFCILPWYFGINWITEGNYMFLSSGPTVITDVTNWPWMYFCMGWLVFMLLVSLILSSSIRSVPQKDRSSNLGSDIV